MDDHAEFSRPPWSPDVVAALNAWQAFTRTHPFTCPRHSRLLPLVATEFGWFCPNGVCEYTQEWAHQHMTTPPPVDWRPFTGANFETFYDDPVVVDPLPGAVADGTLSAPSEDIMTTATANHSPRQLGTYPITGKKTVHDIPKGASLLGTTRVGGQPHVLTKEDRSQPTEKRTFVSRDVTKDDAIQDGDTFIGNYREDASNPDDALMALFELCKEYGNDGPDPADN